jgi:hypothetical protein
MGSTYSRDGAQAESIDLTAEGRNRVARLTASCEEGYLLMEMPRVACVLAVLLLMGCAPTWQAPAGLSPAAQASDRAACEEDARQAAAVATAQTGTDTAVELARLETLTQCLEARGWRLQKRAP